MVNFFDALDGLKTRITGVTAAKVLGAPPGEIMVRAPAVQYGAEQQAAGDSKRQTGEIPEVRWLYWGDPTTAGGVTIFTTKKGYALLQDDSEIVRFQAAHRIARWVTSQPRWAGNRQPSRSPAPHIPPSGRPGQRSAKRLLHLLSFLRATRSRRRDTARQGTRPRLRYCHWRRKADPRPRPRLRSPRVSS